jgi:hypothetical protein
MVSRFQELYAMRLNWTSRLTLRLGKLQPKRKLALWHIWIVSSSRTQPSNRDYQKITLNITFDAKQELNSEARLVSGWHLADAAEYSIYFLKPKSIYVKLLHVIVQK